MNPNQDYYQILGLSKEASADEIRRAYREMALKHHPDRAAEGKKKEAEEQFKKISEAYAVLSDPDKKAFYDHQGYTSLHEKYTPEDLFQGTDFSSIFDSFSDFGLGGGLFDSFFHHKNHPQTSSMQVTLEISLEESILGTVKTLDIPKKIPCPDCDKIPQKPCPHCGQTGQLSSFQGNMHFIQTCPSCRGKGKIPQSVCATCQGSGFMATHQKVEIHIPPATEEGSILSLSLPGKTLFVSIQIKPHPIFKREKNNLLTNLTIPLTIAILGGEISVPTLSGSVLMTIPPGTQNNKIFRLKGKGVPINPSQNEPAGDELVTITVEIPTHLSPKQKQLIEEFAKELPN